MTTTRRTALSLLLLLCAVPIGGCSYNTFVGQEEAIKAQWAQVENVLQRRNDLIPNLVETVKGYAKHEQTVFKDISEALESFNRATTVQDKIAADDRITSLLGRILAVSIQYPNLKADEHFLRLQDELAGT